jgi:RNA polymerase sigma-70 factor (ECF subfamily)
MNESVLNPWREDAILGSRSDDEQLATRQSMDRFLAEVEARAFRMVQIAVRNEADALDIVQDAMMRLVQNYARRPASEWRPLFFRILQNRLRDHQRHQGVRNRVLSWFRPADDDDYADPIAQAPGREQERPDREVAMNETLSALEQAVAALPARQQQAFLLRSLEGLDVAETAQAMGCSQGSVKTHYFRAVHSLRETLGEHWE